MEGSGTEDSDGSIAALAKSFLNWTGKAGRLSFADPHHSIADQVLRSYEYKDKRVNRMVLGDSLY